MEDHAPGFDPQAEQGLHPEAPPQAPGPGRRTVVRRLSVLLVLALAGFTLAAWALVRFDLPAGLLSLSSGPSLVVRNHLEALNRGEVRGAYNFFSPKYRTRIPYEDYRDLVGQHPAMFQTVQMEISGRRTRWGRIELETRLLTADGRWYRARFALIRAQGRWWIDAVRWRLDAERRTWVST